MPSVSSFYGIHIYLYFDDKHQPHFHAIYAEYRAIILIEDGRLLAGSLPKRALRLVREWSRLHRVELEADWERARRGESLIRIKGLDEE
jgi:hypothetical protein